MWMLFSYTIPATHPNVRVKAWRRLQAVGAVQLKSSLYVLPDSEAHYEHFQWLAREVEELGGEAVFFRTTRVENMTQAEIQGLFTKAREEDYTQLEKEMQAWRRAWEETGPSLRAADKEGQAALKKFTRRWQTIRELDFFPSGRAERTAMALAALAERLQIGGSEAGPEAGLQLKKEDYRGRIWVTRARPYIDRLASFWLVRRFIDPEARIEFLAPGEEGRPGGNRVGFDMVEAEFTHREQKITFEVMAAAFGLEDQGVRRLAALVRAVDLKEDLEGLDEAKMLQDLVDGLLMIIPNDDELINRAMLIFDSLYKTYQGGKA